MAKWNPYILPQYGTFYILASPHNLVVTPQLNIPLDWRVLIHFRAYHLYRPPPLPDRLDY